jgi:hypothetical protein
MKPHALYPSLSGRRMRARRRQRGQSVVWLLATLAASAAVMLAVYSTSQVTVNQQRTVNAADAAALAGATVEARLLNLVAYNNRAIVANEAFLIQMLSLESWTQYLQTTSSNISKVTRFIPYVGQVISTVLQQLSQVASQVRQGLGTAINGIIAALEFAKQGAELAHGAALSAGSAMAEDAARTVVAANRSTFGNRTDAGATLDNSMAVRGLTFAKNITAWNNFTERYDGNRRTDARFVLMASRDDFSTSRPGAWWTNFTLPFGVAGTEKNGGSQLKANNSSRDGFDRWETQDTLELWTLGFKGRNYVPIGWGRSNADRNGSKGNTMPPNRSAQSLARSQGSTHRGWSGVPRLYDISDKSVANRDKLEIPFAVVVRRAQNAALTANTIGMGTTQLASPTGSPHMPERLRGDSYHAMAKARVFFERPQRGLANDFTASSLWRPDGAKEYGSLFSPYWQARLVDFGNGEKMALLGAMGITPDHAYYTPGGQR